MKYILICLIILIIIFGVEFIVKVKSLEGNFTKRIKKSLISRINVIIVLSIILFVLFILNITLYKTNKYDHVKDGYIAVFYGGSGEVTYSTYIYKIDNGKANMGFEYINTINSTKSWGSSDWNSEVVSSGEFDFTDGAFIIAKKHGAYDYVIDSYTNQRFTIDEFQDRFIMN